MEKVEINLPSNLKAGAKLKGVFEIEVKDKQGNLISRSRAENVVTAEGLNHMLNVELWDTTKIATWYCLIFETNTTPSDTTTYATPIFTEWASYDEATRPEYNNAQSPAKSTTNSANKAVFTANATKTLYGAALVGGGSTPSTKSDTTGGGTMFCAGKFAANQPVVDDNVVNLTYTVTGADAG
jgi:hypothetical protein